MCHNCHGTLLDLYFSFEVLLWKKKKRLINSFCSVSFAVSHSSTIELNVKILHQWNTLVISMMAAVVVGDGWSSKTTDCTNVITLRPLHTHNTAAHTGLQVSSFQCLWLWLSVWAKKEKSSFSRMSPWMFFKNCCCTFENEILPEHFIHVHSGQPEAVRVAVIIAGASTVALDERRGAELLQTGAGRGESLTWALSTCTGVLLHRETEKTMRVKGESGC